MAVFKLSQLGRDSPEIVKTDILYVIVHPFFAQDNPLYTERIIDLIKNSPHPSLTLENWELTDELMGNGITIKRYENLSPKAQRYFLSNERIYAEPKIGWDKTAKIIKEFSPNHVYIAGSKLTDLCNNHKQCVGTTFLALKERLGEIVTIDKDRCYIENSIASVNGTFVRFGDLMSYYFSRSER